MEAIILLICFLAAHFQVNKGASVKASWEYESFMNSTHSVYSNILDKSFGGNGVSGFTSIWQDEAGIPGADDSNILYKYYTFNLSDQGITSHMTKAAPGMQMSGIVSNTATSTVVQQAKSTFTLGNFKIANDYVSENLDLVKILEKPLVIEPMEKSGILIYHVHATEGYCKTEADKSDLKNYSVEGELPQEISYRTRLHPNLESKCCTTKLFSKKVFNPVLHTTTQH